MSETPPIPVACAVIERRGHVLVAQRPAGKLLALKWEFPGGKVEVGEQPSAAIIREIREELGCEVEIVRAMQSFRHDYGTVVITMFPFVCRLTTTSPEPIAHEHVAIQWVAPADLLTYDLAAADLPVVAAYQSGK